MLFVLDCSVAISWCLEDENSNYANAVLKTISEEYQALVPAFFWSEITNVMWVAEQRSRNTREQTNSAIAMLQALPIIIDSKPVNETITATLNLARQYNLAAYDAAYLELAVREGLILATIDEKLANAARNLSILLEDPNIKKL